MPKVLLDSNVLDAAKERISWTFDSYQRVYVSFSGGKDSTVMLHLVMEEAIKRGVKVGVMFIDWECQFTVTIEHIQAMFDLYQDHIEPYWICLPMASNNSCSQYEPMWKCWDEAKKPLWVREKPSHAIKNPKFFPFYYDGITFEEFTPLFSKWYSKGELTANFVGIRAGESLNRFRAISRDKATYKGKMFTTNSVDECWSVYPIYDWHTEDIWVYNSKGNPYNPLYNTMYKAGLTVHQMRIDEPFGDESRKGLWLYQIIEPKMWAKIVSRVQGVNTVNEYGKRAGNILGNHHITLPEGHTWESFANYILQTMPPKTSEHYTNKIAKYLQWYKVRDYEDGIPDEVPIDVFNKAPSWQRVCKCLLKNDYWCTTLGFSITKSSNYEKYLNLMRRKRKEWGIFKSEDYELETIIK